MDVRITLVILSGMIFIVKYKNVGKEKRMRVVVNEDTNINGNGANSPRGPIKDLG